MSVPDYQEAMLPFLRALADGAEHSVADVRDRVAAELKVTEKDRAEVLPSGRQSIFDNRVGWAKTYLDKAGLLTTVKRGVYKITDAGRALLAEKPAKIDKAMLFQKSESFRAFAHREVGGQAGTPLGVDEPSRLATPEEVLENAYRAVRARVESELLEYVRKASYQFFEKLVVELLVQMGYGGSLEDAGRALGKSHDGGIDGMIKEDHLGLEAIYIQAKRWDATVGRPDVQAFAGSLEGERARKGVMLTTSTFSAEAIQYVKRIEKKIVLIDGLQLAALMFDFGVGVNDVSAYKTKRVDGDYFSEE